MIFVFLTPDAIASSFCGLLWRLGPPTRRWGASSSLLDWSARLVTEGCHHFELVNPPRQRKLYFHAVKRREKRPLLLRQTGNLRCLRCPFCHFDGRILQVLELHSAAAVALKLAKIFVWSQIATLCIQRSSLLWTLQSSVLISSAAVSRQKISNRSSWALAAFSQPW